MSAATSSGYDSTVGIQFVADVSHSISQITHLDYWLNKLSSRFKAVGIAAGVTAGIWAMAHAFEGIIETGMHAEVQIAQLKTQLQGVAPAGKEAEMAMKEYRMALRTAADTPFNTHDVVQAAVSLRQVGIDPLTRSYKNLNAEQVAQGKTTLNAIQILGNAATAVGKDISEIMHGFQSATKGEFTSLDFSLGAEFANARKGLAGLAAGTDAYKKKMLEIIAAIPRFQTGMADMQKTMKGIFAEINDQIAEFMLALSGPFASDQFSIYNAIKNTLAEIRDWLEHNATGFRTLAMVLSLVLSTLWEIAKVLVSVLIAPFRAVVQYLTDMAEMGVKVADSYETMSRALKRMGDWLNAFWRRLAVFFAGVQIIIGKAITAILKGIKAVANALGVDIVSALKTFGAILGWMAGTAILKRLIPAIAALVKSIFTLKNAFALLSKVALFMVIHELIRMYEAGMDAKGMLIVLGGTVLWIYLNYYKWMRMMVQVRQGIFAITKHMSAKRFALLAVITAVALIITHWKEIKEWWDKSSPTVKFLVGALVSLVGVIGTVIAITKAWTAVQTVINFLLTANPIGVIIMAIAALVAGIAALIEYWDILVYKIQHFDQWLKESKFLKFMMSFTPGGAGLNNMVEQFGKTEAGQKREKEYKEGLAKLEAERAAKGGGPISQMFGGPPQVPGGALPPAAVIPPSAATPVPAVAATAVAASRGGDQNIEAQMNMPVTINAAPGQDEKKIAEVLKEEFRKNGKQMVSDAMKMDKNVDNLRRSGYAM